MSCTKSVAVAFVAAVFKQYQIDSPNKCSYKPDTSCTWLHCGHLCNSGHDFQKCLSNSRPSPEYIHLQNGHCPRNALPSVLQFDSSGGGDILVTGVPPPARPPPPPLDATALWPRGDGIGMLLLPTADFAEVRGAYIDRSDGLKPNFGRWCRFRSIVIVFKSLMQRTPCVGDAARCMAFVIGMVSCATLDATEEPPATLTCRILSCCCCCTSISLRRCTSSLSNSVKSCRYNRLRRVISSSGGNCLRTRRGFTLYTSTRMRSATLRTGSDG